MEQTSRADVSPLPDGQTAKSGKHLRWRRRLLFGCGILILFVLMVCLFLPTLLSTGAGTDLLVLFINNSIPGSIEIDDLDIAWRKSQHARGVTLRPPVGEPFTIEVVDAPDAALWSFLWGSRDFGRVPVSGAVGQPDVLASVFVHSDSKEAFDVVHQASIVGANTLPSPVARRDLRVKLEFTDAHLFYTAPQQGTVEALIPSGVMDVNTLQQVRVQLTGEVKRGDLAGTLDLNIRVDDLFGPSGEWQLDQARIVDCAAKLSRLPVALLDRILKQEGLLEALIGPTLDGEVYARHESDHLNADIDLRGERLDASGQFVRRGDRIEGRARFQMRVIGETWSALSVRLPALARTALARPFDLQGRIRDLVIPMVGNEAKLMETSGRADIIGTEVVLEVPNRFGRVTLDGPTFTVLTESLGVKIDGMLRSPVKQAAHGGNVRLAATIRDAFDDDGEWNEGGLSATFQGELTNLPSAVVEQFVPQLADLSSEAIGPTVDVRVSVRHDPEIHEDLWTAGYTATVKAELLELDLAGTIGPRLANGSGRIAWTATPLLFDALANPLRDTMAPQFRDLSFAGPARVLIDLTDVAVHLEGEGSGLERMTGDLSVRVDELVPDRVEALRDTVVRSLELKVKKGGGSEGDTGGGPLELTAAAQVQHGSRLSRWQAEGSIVDLQRPTQRFTARATGTDVPVPLLAQIIHRSGELAPTLGETVDRVAITVGHDAAQPGRWVFDGTATSSAGLEVKLRGESVGDRSVTLQDGSALRLIVTPEAFASWFSDPDQPDVSPDWRLGKPARLHLMVKSARLVLRDGPEDAPPLDQVDPAATNLNATLVVDQIAMWHRGDEKSLPLDGLTVSVRADRLSGPIESTIRTRFEQAPAGAEEPAAGVLDASFRVDGLYGTDGRFDSNRLPLVFADAELNDFPLGLAGRFWPAAAFVMDIMGPTVSGTVRGYLFSDTPRDLDIAVRSSFAEIEVAGTVGREMILRDDMQARFSRLTPPMVEKGLRTLLPIVGQIVSVEQAISVKVKKEKFRMPMVDFNISDVQAVADVSLGELRFRPRGDLATLLSILGVRDSKRTRATVLPTTIYLDNGVLTYNDLTMSVHGIPLSFSGNVDLASQAVDLVMDISVDALAAHIKQLSGVFRPGEVIEVPIRGKIGDTRMELNQLKAEIMRLAGTTLLLEGLGEDGRIIGNILGDLLGGNSRRKMPRPLPQDEQRLQSPDLEQKPDEEGPEAGADAGPDQSGDPFIDLWNAILKDREEKERRKKEHKKKKEREREEI